MKSESSGRKAASPSYSNFKRHNRIAYIFGELDIRDSSRCRFTTQQIAMLDDSVIAVSRAKTFSRTVQPRPTIVEFIPGPPPTGLKIHPGMLLRLLTGEHSA